MDNGQIHVVSAQQIKKNAGWFLGLGIGLVVLGTLAVIYAYASTLFLVSYLGVFLMIVGVIEGVHAFKMRTLSLFFLHLFLSLIYMFGGFYIMRNPLLSALTLTYIAAVFFVIVGIARIMFALMQQVPHKGWLLFNGIVTTILGGLIWYQWPVSGLWVIGMLVGVEAIFTGWTWIMLSSVAKNMQVDVVMVEKK